MLYLIINAKNEQSCFFIRIYRRLVDGNHFIDTAELFFMPKNTNNTGETFTSLPKHFTKSRRTKLDRALLTYHLGPQAVGCCSWSSCASTFINYEKKHSLNMLAVDKTNVKNKLSQLFYFFFKFLRERVAVTTNKCHLELSHHQQIFG